MTLAKLKQVDPRKLWPEEDTDFTPWLPTKEGLAILGETLGMELELENTEVTVGNYRADIITVQELLGHTSVSTTMIYTMTDARRKHDAVELLVRKRTPNCDQMVTNPDRSLA